MNELLEQAFARAAQLPEPEQAILAALILEELANEQRWHAVFARSPETLEQLADEAPAELDRGETVPLDPDRL